MTLLERVASIRRNYNLPGMFENLRKVSDDKYSGCCPMHGGDNRNGFAVSRRDGEWRWRCFTWDCGFGDAIDLVMSRERCSMREAVDILDGGGAYVDQPGLSANRAAVVNQVSAPSTFLVCDACRREAIEVKPREYGGGSRVKWTSTVELEAATAHGWELSAGLDYAIGPRCLEARP
jgi:hypothetical protein